MACEFGDIGKRADDLLDDFSTDFTISQTVATKGKEVSAAFDFGWNREKGKTDGQCKLTLPVLGEVSFVAPLFEDPKHDVKETPLSISFTADDSMHGQAGLEASVEGAVPLRLDALKSVHKDLEFKLTYSGIEGARFELAKSSDLDDSSAEVTVAKGNAVVGAKFSLGQGPIPDLGVQYDGGPFFGAVTTSEKLSVFDVFAAYKHESSGLQVGANFRKEKQSFFSVGLAYQQWNLLYTKNDDGNAISAQLQTDLAEGMNVKVSGKFNPAESNFQYGVALAIE